MLKNLEKIKFDSVGIASLEIDLIAVFCPLRFALVFARKI
jgi:hypothetical protein